MKNKLILSSLRAVVATLVVASLFLQSGCQRKAVVKQRRISVAPTASKNSPFDVAMDFLNNLDQYQPDQVQIQILDNLRDWAREEEVPVNWIADPMVRRLPKALASRFTPDELATKKFELFDVLELQQAVWLRDVAKKVASTPLRDQRVAAWLEQAVLNEELTKDDADDLSLAYRLFDWVVRNVQLDHELDPIDFFGGQETIDKRDRTTVMHKFYPWQTMLYGHGDFEERSRLFILLGRQLGIDIVMLIADRGEDQIRQSWANGVLLGDELFVFDTKLGIPLPGQGGAVFSRLTDYVANPDLLAPLSAAGQRYRIVKSDLNKLVACIDATPAALSQRMKQIEGRLQGERKMLLTIAPNTLAKQLRTCKHVNKVEIWPLPYRTYRFIEKFKNDPSLAPDLYVVWQSEQRAFATRGSIMRGRLLQLRGLDRGDFDTPGAKKLYMGARLSKKELQRFNIPMNQLPKDSPLLAGLPEDPSARKAVFDARLRSGRQMAVNAKDVATYWLGMIAMDQHEYRVATDFLQLNATDDESRWQQGAHYNLGRAYEAMAMGDERDADMLSKAIEHYQAATESPQRAGNAVRATRLKSELSP